MDSSNRWSWLWFWWLFNDGSRTRHMLLHYGTGFRPFRSFSRKGSPAARWVLDFAGVSCQKVAIFGRKTK